MTLAGRPRRARSRTRDLQRGARLLASASLVTASVLVVGIVPLATGAGAGTSIGADQQRVNELEQEIASRGARAQQLVTSYDQVQLELEAISAEIHQDNSKLALDVHSESVTASRLRRTAINAYIDAAAAGTTSFPAFSSLGNAGKLAEQQTYLGVASDQLSVQATALVDAEHKTSGAESTLVRRKAQAVRVLAQLASARSAATASIASEQSVLAGVNHNLAALVDAAEQHREAAEAAAAERALAARAAAAAAEQAAPAPTATVAAAPGAYANPLRAIGGLTNERIDQGVDYSGSGPIYALGDGTVLSTSNGGWPGGTFITYRLTDGPANGLIVYSAEDIEPLVSPGEQVTPHTVIGQVYEGPTGIELGWASSPDGLTMAAVYGQFGGGNSTAFGASFSSLLSSLGAPGGVLQNNPPTGSLPAGWPSF